MIMTILKGTFALFWILDPLGNIPIYVSFIRNMSNEDIKRTVNIASMFAILIFLLFIFGGQIIFTYLNFKLQHIMIAGGLLLLILGIDMMFGPEREVKSYKDIAIVPLGMPLMSGPGSIATVLLLSATYDIYVALTCLAIALVVQYFIYIAAKDIIKFAGKNSLRLMAYLAALIAASFGIEMIIKGLTSL
ncbi:MAG: MarC family protein [Candidatus Methanofastidiosa archaeon]|nr:MarC family protein [Candidatus Methanofastidiosa archaeon]